MRGFALYLKSLDQTAIPSRDGLSTNDFKSGFYCTSTCTYVCSMYCSTVFKLQDTKTKQRFQSFAQVIQELIALNCSCNVHTPHTANKGSLNKMRSHPPPAMIKTPFPAYLSKLRRKFCPEEFANLPLLRRRRLRPRGRPNSASSSCASLGS